MHDISLVMAENEKNILENIGEQEYKYGFTTDIETETIGKGLSEEVVRLISAKKGEPEWMTERLSLIHIYQRPGGHCRRGPGDVRTRTRHAGNECSTNSYQ